MREVHEPIPLEVRRGPAEHERRDQIIEAAQRHFRAHGYEKTSVAELAKAIGVSSAYIYRFFDSKRSIGEAACAMTLAAVARRLFAVASADDSATQRLRQFYRTLLEEGYALFIHERRMHELVANAVSQQWDSVRNHRTVIRTALRSIVVSGREAGEFERKTPLDEVVLALAQAAVPFAHPMLLQQRDLEELRESASAVTSMVLRSLAP